MRQMNRGPEINKWIFHEAEQDLFRSMERRPGQGLTSDHAVLTDELIDHLAERFISGRIRQLTRCSFELYIRHPEAYDRMATVLSKGYAIRQDESHPENFEILIPMGMQVMMGKECHMNTICNCLINLVVSIVLVLSLFLGGAFF